MGIAKFTDLEAWKVAHQLTLAIYKATNTFPKEEVFGLISQLRRAAVSIESCIAEGFSRYHYKERIHFYYTARGSLGEVESQIITSRDLEYLSEPDFNSINALTEKTSVILGGLIRSTERLTKG